MKRLARVGGCLKEMCRALFFPEAEAENAHILLNWKDCGPCKRLTGDVEIAVILVSLPDAPWNGPDGNALKENLRLAANAIEKEAAKHGVWLRLSIRCYTAKAARRVDNTEDSVTWAETVLDSDSSLPAYNRDAYSYDSRPVVFCLNTPGRAFARMWSTEAKAEFAVLYGIDGAKTTLSHELLHLYGARDYYLPRELKAAATEHCPDSVMLASGMERPVDSMTAYIVGWTNVLDAQAKALMTAAEGLTEEDIRKARKEDNKNGFNIVREETFAYAGTLRSGMKHGWGRIRWNDDSLYTGNWEWGVRIGYGRQNWPEGYVYIGEYRDSKRHGWGRMVGASGSIYIGNYVADKRTGHGVQSWPNGEVYVGDFVGNNRTGQGVYTWANGDVYIGDFIDNSRNGKGMYVWANGDVYVGDFVDNNRTGQGVYTWANGDVFTGRFELGKRTDGVWSKAAVSNTARSIDVTYRGMGVRKYADGSVYIGELVNGQRSGMGMLRFLNGTLYAGNFVNGKYHGTGTLTHMDGTVYSGSFADCMYNGEGIIVYEDGGIYAGGFENAQYHGQGTYAWPNGSFYNGGFRYGQYQGSGMFYGVNGTVKNGQWERGEFLN